MRNFVEFVLKFLYSTAYSISKPIRTPITAVVYSYHTTKQPSVYSCHNKTAYVYSYNPKITAVVYTYQSTKQLLFIATIPT